MLKFQISNEVLRSFLIPCEYTIQVSQDFYMACKNLLDKDALLHCKL